jgi:uncharacterized protein
MGEALRGRVAELVRALELVPHPEGGFYREIWRSRAMVMASRSRERAALTAIYFLLPRAAVSRWHRVRSDEIWHHCEGAPLDLWLVPPDASRLERARVGPLAPDQAPVHVVPADWWQAARSNGAYTLVVRSVGPGFDFADFRLLAADPLADTLCRALPAAKAFL